MIILKKKITSIFYYIQWVYKTREQRKAFSKYKVLSIEKTVKEIIENKKSISRYGDGEFRLMLPEFVLHLQENSEPIRERLKEVLMSDLENHLVCIPEPLYSVTNFKISTKYWWKNFINKYGTRINPYLKTDKTYGNSFISRFYLEYKNNTDRRKRAITKSLKSIWDKQSLLIVEGEFSRLGVGNNLFDNAASIERIICPAEHAFRIYSVILETIKKLGKDKLIIIALGPTATILAYDLAREDYWALDLGHIDIEYMWSLMGAQEKSPIKGRIVYEVKEQESFDIDDKSKKKYEQSIIMRIKNPSVSFQ